MKRIASCALAITFAFTACNKSGTTETGGRVNAWTQPHVLRYATAEDINTLNPHLGQQTTLFLMATLTMAWLIKWDVHNQPYPELATEVPTKANGGVSPDGTTITFHLRKGVKWSDGAPFDADDVVFSTNVVNDKANNEVGTAGWNLISKIDEPDKYTVVYHLKKPYSPFVETFFSSGGANPCVLPKHLLAKYPNINNVPYNSLPVGIGPFKYERWDRGQQVVMVPNPTYWRGQPKLQKIVFKIVPDRNTVLSQLESHELDAWWPTTGAYVQRAAQIEGLTQIRQPSYLFDHYDFNVTRPAVSDPVVRRALRMGINRPQMLNTVLHGVGVLQESMTPKTSPYYVEEPLQPFDIAGANKLLDDGGWTRGSDGVRAKNGVKLDLEWATATGTPDADAQIELVRGWWKQLGVSITVRHYPPPQLFAPIQQGGIIYGGKFDIVSFAWTPDAIGDLSVLYGCDVIPPNGQNDPRWCDSIAQAAMDKVFTDYDQPARTADDKVVVDEVVKQAPTIVIRVREDVWTVNKDLKNFHPNNVTPYDNMMDVDI